MKARRLVLMASAALGGLGYARIRQPIRTWGATQAEAASPLPGDELLPAADRVTTRAIDIAHTRLVWCDAESTVAEVAEEMMEHYVRHVLVEDEGLVIGIVSARDLLGAYASVECLYEDE